MNDRENRDEPPADAPKPEFLREFEQVIQSFAEATEAGKTEEATDAALRALMMAAAEAAQNPTPDLQLANAASECEETGDWIGAEQAYRQLIELREQGDNHGLIAKPRMDLSRLLRLLGRLDEAWACALAATAAARAADMSPLTAMALENQAMCALQRGDTAQALEAASQAFAVLEPGRLTAHMRARALVNRAECRLACGDDQGGESDLQSSWELIDPETLPPTLPGYKAVLGKWWEVRAKLDLHRGDANRAAHALKQAIAYRRQGMGLSCGGNPYSAWALAKQLEAFARVVERCGDSGAATDAASEAKLLRERSHLPAADNAGGA